MIRLESGSTRSNTLNKTVEMVKKYWDSRPPTQRWLRSWYDNLSHVIEDLKAQDQTQWIDYYPDTGPQLSRPQSQEEYTRFFSREGDALVAQLPVVSNFQPVLAFVRYLQQEAKSYSLHSTERVLHLALLDSETGRIAHSARIIRTQDIITDKPLHHKLIDPTTNTSLNRGEAKFIKSIFDRAIS